MRTEMDDIEFADLENRLRRSVVGRRPEAPDALVSFADTVPERMPVRRWTGLAGLHPGVRRGLVAIATAAAVVVAVGGGALLVSINPRTSHRPAASSAVTAPVNGWKWQPAHGTPVQPGTGFRVAGGYVGQCYETVDSASIDAGVYGTCSSPDGVKWALPPDPGIVAFEGDQGFRATAIVRFGSVYVALGRGGSRVDVNQGATAQDFLPLLWRSTDGVHWSRVASSTFDGLYLEGVTQTVTGFLAVGEGTNAVGRPGTENDLPAADGIGWALTSTDGLDWVRSARLPANGGLLADSSAGLYLTNYLSGAPKVWHSDDGRTWTPVYVPGGIVPTSVFRSPGGEYVGIEQDFRNSNVQHLLRSADGLTWRADQGNLKGTMISVVKAGNCLFASVYLEPFTQGEVTAGTYKIWVSTDWGKTWQPVNNSAGRQMTGLVDQMGGTPIISTVQGADTRWRIVWVGVPDYSATPTP